MATCIAFLLSQEYHAAEILADLLKDGSPATATTALLALERAPEHAVRYADADHGFNCNDRPAVYNPAAAADAWQRTLAWFDAHIGAN